MGKRFISLDGLRGLAMLMVLVTHGMQSWRQPYDKGLNGVIDTGWIALDIFFVLSGFLITGILLDTRTADGYFRTFYARRALRIAPLYYAYCGFLFGLVPLFVTYKSLFYGKALWYFSFLLSIPLTVYGSRGAAPYGNFFWSVAVEEQFYVLWPFLVAKVSTRSLRRLCLAMIVVAFISRILIIAAGYQWGAYVLLPCRMGALACGAWLAIVVRESPQQLRRARAWFFGCAVGVLAIIVKERTGWFLTPGMSTVGSTLVSFMSSALLVMALTEGRVSSFLSSPTLLFFAKYSYALYVFDILAVKLAYEIVGASGSVAARIARLLLSVLIDIPAALVSWHILEKRFLALQKRFPYRPRSAPRLPEAQMPHSALRAELQNTVVAETSACRP